MIDDALTPDRDAALASVHAGEHGGVLHRDHGLVIVAVEGPGPDLILRELAVVQQPVERVQVVVAACADVAQSRLELVGAEEPPALGGVRGREDCVHGVSGLLIVGKTCPRYRLHPS